MQYRKPLLKTVNSNRPFTTALCSYFLIMAISGCDRGEPQTEITDSSNELEQSSVNVELPPPAQKTIKIDDLNLSLPQEAFDVREKNRLDYKSTPLEISDDFSTRSEEHYKITGKPLIKTDSEDFSSSDIEGGKIEIEISID